MGDRDEGHRELNLGFGVSETGAQDQSQSATCTRHRSAKPEMACLRSLCGSPRTSQIFSLLSNFREGGGACQLLVEAAPLQLLRNFTSPPVQETIEEIRSRIFGTHIGDGFRSGRKVLRQKLIGEKIASYYLKPMHKDDPLFEDLEAERYFVTFVFYGLSFAP